MGDFPGWKPGGGGVSLAAVEEAIAPLPWDMTPVSSVAPLTEYVYDATEAEIVAAGITGYPTISGQSFTHVVSATDGNSFALTSAGLATIVADIDCGDVTLPSSGVLQQQITFTTDVTDTSIIAGTVSQQVVVIAGPSADRFQVGLTKNISSSAVTFELTFASIVGGVTTTSAAGLVYTTPLANTSVLLYIDTTARKVGIKHNGVDLGFIKDAANADIVYSAVPSKFTVYHSTTAGTTQPAGLLGKTLTTYTSINPANFTEAAIGTPASWFIGAGVLSDPLIPAGATLLEVTVAGSYAGTAYSVGDIGVVHINGIDVTRVPTQGRSATQITDEIAAAITAHNAATDPHPGYALESTKGVANGIATLDEAGKVPLAQLPNYAQTNVTGSRALNTTYTNSGTRSIIVNATARCVVSVAGGNATVQGKSDTATPPTTITSGLVGIQSGLLGEDNTHQISFVVAPGANYRIDSAVTDGAVTLGSWFEVSL